MLLEIGEYVIRDWSAEDAPTLARHANNPRVAGQLRDRFPHPYALEDAQAFIERALEAEPRSIFPIASDEEVIGSIGLMLGQDVHRYTAELGYWIAEPYWGRGIATSAIKAITRWGLEERGLHRIHADVFSGNDASARALEKAGYTLESRTRASVVKQGVVRDQLIYVTIREGIHEGLELD